MRDYTSSPLGCLQAVIENGEVLNDGIVPGVISSQRRNVNVVITLLFLKRSQHLKLTLIQEVGKGCIYISLFTW